MSEQPKWSDGDIVLAIAGMAMSMILIIAGLYAYNETKHCHYNEPKEAPICVSSSTDY